MTPSVYHFYGMTTACMGLPERDFIAANSRPSHAWNECLRELRKRHGIANRIYLYTEGRVRRSEVIDGQEWVLVPATWGGSYHRAPLGKFLRRPHYQFSVPFLREIEMAPPDLFVFYGNVPTPFSLLVARRLKRLGVPYILTVHTRFENLFCREVAGRAARRLIASLVGAPLGREAPALFAHAAAVVLLTEEDRAEALRRMIVQPERIQVIPSGISSDYFHPGRDEARAPYPTLCFVGRMEEAKGFLEAVRCLAAVRRHFPEARLHVAGAWTSDRYRRRVEGLIEERGLARAVVLHGWLRPEELGDLYRMSHLMLFPSKREGLPRAVIEAMACGVPVAAVRGTGGHGDLVVHGANGLITAAEDWESEVVSLLRRRESMGKMARSAVASVERSYSMEAMLTRVESLYLPLVNRAR